MKNISLIVPFILLNLAAFAQQNEVWLENGSGEEISTIDSYHAQGEENFPEINLNYSFEEGMLEDPVPEYIVYRNYRLFNNKDFNIGYSDDGDAYSTLVTISNGSTKLNNHLRVTSNSYLDGLAWLKNDLFLENGKFSIGKNLTQVTDKFHVEGSSRLNGNVLIDENLYVNSIASTGNFLTFQSNLHVPENNYIEFGWGLDKHEDAGKIGYQLWTPNLDIVGAGETIGDRNIRLWDKVTIGNRNIGPHTDAELHVNGKIVAQRIITTAHNWADYVFEDGYELRNLEELHIFIKQNGHLPNIPSTQEVMDSGIDVADMNRLLLEKIEELTLYVIELQEQIDDLR